MTPAVLSEQQLHASYLACGMFLPASTDLLEEAAGQAFRWAIAERYKGIVHEPPRLREEFGKRWKALIGSTQNSAYWKGWKQAAGVARRIYEFTLKYEVSRPYRPYELTFPEGTIRGQYALGGWSKSKRSEQVPVVIVAHARWPRGVIVPHHPGLAQWIAARQDVGCTAITSSSGPSGASSCLHVLVSERWNSNVAASERHVAGCDQASAEEPCEALKWITSRTFVLQSASERHRVHL